jgi:glycosyltransferase involved in cell wall biosynthesis
VQNRAVSEKPPGRLLFVVNVAWFFISHRLALAEAAKRAGWEVHIAAGAATPAEISLLTNAGFHFHDIALERSSRNPLKNAALFVRFIRLYRKVRPYLVHHITIKPVMLGTLVARILNVPSVVNAVSGLGYSFSSNAYRKRLLHSIVGIAYRACLSHPNMTIIFQNPDDRADFLKWTGIESLKSVLIAGSGVDVDAFRPTPEPDTTIRVTLPARMLRDKGVIEFSKSIGDLKKRGLLIEGLLAGAIDPENPESLTVADLHQLEMHYGVKWVGHCKDIVSLLAHTHIVCLPSYREGLPKALIEASATGRAIVTTNVPGCRHVVEHDVTGLLVPPRSVDALTDAIAKLSSNAELRRRLGRAARLRAEQEFALNHIVSSTLLLYEK